MEKLKNFWYHYKFRTIFFTFLALVVAVGVYSYATKENYDIQVFLYTSKTLPSDIAHSLEQTIEDVYEKNGEKVNVGIIDYSYDPYSKDGDAKANYASALSGEMRLKNNFVFVTDKFRFEELSENEKLENLFLADNSVFDKYKNTTFSIKNSKFEKNLIKKIENNGTKVVKMPEYFVSVMNCENKNDKNYKKALELVKMIKSEG